MSDDTNQKPEEAIFALMQRLYYTRSRPGTPWGTAIMCTPEDVMQSLAALVQDYPERATGMVEKAEGLVPTLGPRFGEICGAVRSMLSRNTAQRTMAELLRG